MYRRKDAFYQRAKESGYRSRAAFKLIELAKSERLFRSGDRVLDLGAWPGGWSQVAADLVGPKGRVIAVDRRPIDSLKLPNVDVLVGDLGEAQVSEQVRATCGGPVQVVLSDLAPSLTGIKARDEAEGARLLDIVLTHVRDSLVPGGTLLTKIFMGGEFTSSIARIKQAFEQVRIIRPEATRKGSSELYVLARRFRGALEKVN